MIKKYIIRLQAKGYTRVQIEEEVLKLEIEYPNLPEETLYRMVFENLRYEINCKIILMGF